MIAGLTPTVSWMVVMPRRVRALSMRSSCTSVAVWMNSMPIARLNAWSRSGVPERGAEQHERRAQALAAGANDVLHGVGHRAEVGAHRLLEAAFELDELGRDRGEQLVDDDAHRPAPESCRARPTARPPSARGARSPKSSSRGGAEAAGRRGDEQLRRRRSVTGRAEPVDREDPRHPGRGVSALSTTVSGRPSRTRSSAGRSSG